MGAGRHAGADRRHLRLGVRRPGSHRAGRLGCGYFGAWLVVRRLMGLDWTFLPMVAVGVAIGAMTLTLAFGLAGTLAALRQRPLALLRNE